MSVYYTYLYGALGFFISANHLRKHLGEQPVESSQPMNVLGQSKFMLIHDLKIIATSMGLVQYACLVSGCLSENPSLFLPHLFGQMTVVLVKLLNILLVLPSFKTWCKLTHKVPALILLIFNLLQEFCVFRQCLCICDL
ncbi:unnamed protein product [Arctia plantaginis]|uniref:Uncharacterized protein n=1 Tax=Arctia plantaginis TaxID=874455 RepID=A0A8S0YYI9_ARCPL|nr:unnamed protein product [Arctia plantaginis]